ncbi:MAG: Pre-mRNA-splicing factor [Vezdaea aestivalis]|nr:MAG: Pre-mRNA-splicing factor [Vezdaea aestivalis]
MASEITSIENGSPPPTSPSNSTAIVPIKPSCKTVSKVSKAKKRPARPQVDPSTITSEPPPQTGTIFNIWYNKWSGGDREDKYLSKTAAISRCNIRKDSGYTRADSIRGSYFCLFFARGVCPNGSSCEYLHRLPGLHDLYNPNIDAFGRDKHSDYRDDMGGVGSFQRMNRTLYVGRIHVTDDIEEVVARHFAEWGQVDRTRVLTARGVAFVTYTNEANAQFAKEAMAHQALDHEEVLNVRWATQDPNPLAQKREARAIEEQAAEAIRRALPEEFVKEIEGGRKRARIDGGMGLDGYVAPDAVWFSEGRKAEKTLEGREERLIELAPADQPEVDDAPKTGIFGASTLKALQGVKSQGGSIVEAKKPPAGGGISLVGYGSDDDSD